MRKNYLNCTFINELNFTLGLTLILKIFNNILCRKFIFIGFTSFYFKLRQMENIANMNNNDDVGNKLLQLSMAVEAGCEG